MKTYDCPRDLEQWGFNCLTGEACGLGLRLLYDMNHVAHAILARTMGFTVDQIKLSPTWNGGDYDAGSALLTSNQALMCALFGMLMWDKCICVMQPYNDQGRLSDTLYGIEDDVELGLIKETRCGLPRGTEFRTWKLSTMPGSGDLHLHHMSGRLR